VLLVVAEEGDGFNPNILAERLMTRPAKTTKVARARASEESPNKEGCSVTIICEKIIIVNNMIE